MAALRRNKIIDKFIMVLTTAFVSMPSFIMGVLLLIAFVIRLKWLPGNGATAGGLVLPIITLSLYKKIEAPGFHAMLVVNTGVAGLNGTANGQACTAKDFKADELDAALKFVQQDADLAGVLFDTTDDNHVQATVHTFDIDDTAVLVALDPVGHGKSKK